MDSTIKEPVFANCDMFMVCDFNGSCFYCPYGRAEDCLFPVPDDVPVPVQLSFNF